MITYVFNTICLKLSLDWIRSGDRLFLSLMQSFSNRLRYFWRKLSRTSARNGDSDISVCLQYLLSTRKGSYILYLGREVQLSRVLLTIQNANLSEVQNCLTNPNAGQPYGVLLKPTKQFRHCCLKQMKAYTAVPTSKGGFSKLHN